MEGDLLICRCQEITRSEIVEAIRGSDLLTMSEVKRHTRACMGLCQGKTCGHLMMEILAQETGRGRSEIEPDTSRPPVRAVPVEILATVVQDGD